MATKKAAKKVSASTKVGAVGGGIATFKARLKAGHYKSLTGARRGAGRMNLNDAERKAAGTAAKKHFGG